MTDVDGRADLEALAGQLAALACEVRRDQRSRLGAWAGHLADPGYRCSATNLAAYLALRRHDLRPLQDRLAVLGLSSLGRTEAHVRAGIAAVTASIDGILGDRRAADRLIRFARLREALAGILERRAVELLGPEPEDRRTRIMVTLPSEAAGDDGALIGALLDQGMDIARINCAHDGPDAWRAMAALVRDLAKTRERSCRILFDLPGPKMRIVVPDAPGRLRIRSAGGRQPVTILLDGSGAPGSSSVPDDGPPRVAVAPAWLARLRAGDRLQVVDARGKRRELRVRACTADGVEATTRAGLALTEGLRMRHLCDGAEHVTTVGPFERLPGTVPVSVGDTLRIVDEDTVAGVGPAHRDGRAHATRDAEPPRIACRQRGVIGSLEPGHRVVMDDGHVVTVVTDTGQGWVDVRAIATRRPEERLRSDRGLNLPDTDVRGLGFGADDIVALDVATGVADIIGLSFAQDPESVERLVAEMDARGAFGMGIIAKIETQLGVEQLPEIIVAGASRRPFGVMIARGDLAVEIGYERTAEMQEEILWLCEAAHVPVVWATQVLESLVKTGIPTRAELTDAAMAQRAECVMLNKGPYVLDGVETLVDVIERMQTHQHKKTSRLRALASWSSTDAGPS